MQQLGLNPEIGFTVTPLLNTGGSIAVTFQVTITEIPDNEVILNDADVTFTSQPNPHGTTDYANDINEFSRYDN